jgi:hypothetical protein
MNDEEPIEDNLEIPDHGEDLPPAEDDFPKKKPGLSFMARKRRHMLILLGGRAPAHGP